MTTTRALVRVRPYEPRDGPAVRAFWRAGFLEMVWDVTRTLGPLGGPELAVPVRALLSRRMPSRLR
jgi:hypothetical protein